MTDPRVTCAVCGQDWLYRYRNVLDGAEFLLCPECDSVWLPGDDPAAFTEHSLTDVFAGHQLPPGRVDWDYIERAEPGQPG